MGFGERMFNCCKIHWNGFFYFFSPLVILPLIVMEPVKEYRAVFLILWTFIWYVVDAVPVGIIALLPIVFLPILGVLPSQNTCMSYTRDAQMVFLLTTFMGATMEYSNLAKRYAFLILKSMSYDPKKLLIILMSIAYILASFLPSGFVCALMFPITRSILQILDSISVCKAIDESVVLKDDELPCPSKMANALYIGVAFAVNIGGITTAISSDAGLVLRDVIKNETSLANMKENFHIKYSLISYLLTFLLLSFTIFYLLLLFMGFLRKDSKAAQEIVYDKAASNTALDAVGNDLPPYNVHMIMTALLYFLSLFGVLAVAFLTPEISSKLLKFSFNAMLLCFLYFVLPSTCDFCNYFKCSKPKEYKTSPSILTWAIANKLTPWKYFLVFGSSSAIGLTMKTMSLHMFVGDSLIKMKDLMAQQLGLMAMTLVMSILGSNGFVADIMLNMGVMSKGTNSAALLLYPITWCCGMTFLLPISSLANCYAGGWGNLRAKHVILAGIGPTIFGFLIAFVFATVMAGISMYN